MATDVQHFLNTWTCKGRGLLIPFLLRGVNVWNILLHLQVCKHVCIWLHCSAHTQDTRNSLAPSKPECMKNQDQTEILEGLGLTGIKINMSFWLFLLVLCFMSDDGDIGYPSLLNQSSSALSMLSTGALVFTKYACQLFGRSVGLYSTRNQPSLYPRNDIYLYLRWQTSRH